MADNTTSWVLKFMDMVTSPVKSMMKTTNTSFNAPKTQKWHGFEIWEILQEVHNRSIND